MYFPILRGRQFELLALRECVSRGILSNEVIPVVEPVKVSSTFVKTVDAFIEAGKQIAIIRNPQVGSWLKDFGKKDNDLIKNRVYEQLDSNGVISSFYVNAQLHECIELAEKNKIPVELLLLICNNQEFIKYYEEEIGAEKPLYNIIPDKGDFRRRIRPNRVMCEDHFPKKQRNADYIDIETEFFSSDHLYYEDDGYKGFSDYSIIGEEYSDTGFAPFAVVIHIVYPDDTDNLRIAHFVSDSNDDYSDPARKFAEAAKKLAEWNRKVGLDTVGIKELEADYNNGKYPGLGSVKKYSIMHHLELISRYLDSESFR